MKRWILLMLICITCLTGCNREQTLVMYTLPAESVKSNMSPSEIGALAEEKGRQVFKGEDFAGVDWEHQRFSLQESAVPTIGTVTAESGGSAIFKSTDTDVFVWVLNGKALYVGGFERGVSSPNGARDPFIKDEGRYIFAIVSEGEKDLRFNKKLYRYFDQAGLLKTEL